MCKTDRPTLLTQSRDNNLDHLIWIEDPRVALTVQSIIFSCGGFRAGILANGAKSISLAEVDFNECSAVGGGAAGGDSAVSSYRGGPVKIINGAFRNGASPIPSLDVGDGTGSSKGTLLSATGTLFTGNRPDAFRSSIYVHKDTPKKLKAVFRNCKFIDNTATGDSICVVQSVRNDDKPEVKGPGKPLTLDFGGSSWEGAALTTDDCRMVE